MNFFCVINNNYFDIPTVLMIMFTRKASSSVPLIVNLKHKVGHATCNYIQ